MNLLGLREQVPQGPAELDSSLEQMLSEAEARDPRVRLVRALIQRRRQSSQAIDAEFVATRPAASEEPASLVQSVSEAMAELTFLRDRNQDLAAALGACPSCWGTESRCRTCHGRGGPGAVMPELQRFQVLVAPAVTRLARTSNEESEHRRKSATSERVQSSEYEEDGERS